MPTENKLILKQQRAEHVNQAIQIIADHGRQFFYSQASALPVFRQPVTEAA